MHLCPDNFVPIGRVVVYNARAAQAFSAGIKCRHCTVYEGNTAEDVKSFNAD